MDRVSRTWLLVFDTVLRLVYILVRPGPSLLRPLAIIMRITSYNYNFIFIFIIQQK